MFVPTAAVIYIPPPPRYFDHPTKIALEIPIPKHLMSVVIHRNGITPVVVQSLPGFGECQLLVEFPQQQKSRIRGVLTTVKIQDNFRLKLEPELRMIPNVAIVPPFLRTALLVLSLIFVAQLVGHDGVLY